MPAARWLVLDSLLAPDSQLLAPPVQTPLPATSPTSQVVCHKAFLSHMFQVASVQTNPPGPARLRLPPIALALFLIGTLAPAGLRAQAAIDPNVAPKAAALERSGERQMAIDLLGRYLATAPDDGDR